MLHLQILLTVLVVSVKARPDGAPTTVCDSMVPFHQGAAPRTDTAPYDVYPRRTRDGVSVIITSGVGLQFQGFMLQARTPTGQSLGSFEPLGNVAHTINCFNPSDTVTHNSPDTKNLVEAIWTPPRDYEGPVIFNSTIAQDFSTFWTGVQTHPVEIGRRGVTDPDLPIYHTIPTAPPPIFRPIPSREASTEFDPFYEGCGVTKLCFGSPPNCIGSRNCKAVVSVSVMVDRYVFEMKATGGATWVGVGLSDDAKMGDDSVIECSRRGSSVDANMAWTTGLPNYGSTRLRNPKLGIRLLNSSIIDNDVLYCRVVRDIETSVNGKIFNLMNDRYNILIAAGSRIGAFHDLAYTASESQQLLSDVSPVKAASKLLIRLHGSFMLAAWIGTASIGMLLARYYRQTWVGSSHCGKDIWFAWHRILMLLTWSLTMVAFILIFVELKAWSSATIHAVLGTLTTIICFIQPIGAYFRPHPGTSKRPIFNWVHWLGGNTAHILAIVTLFFAVRLTKAELPEFMDWILVAFVIFHVIMHIILSIMNCLSERNSESRVTSLPMKDLSGSGRSSLYADRSSDSPHSGTRKFLLVIYIIIVVALAIALIVITALAPIETSWQDFKTTVMNSN